VDRELAPAAASRPPKRHLHWLTLMVPILQALYIAYKLLKRDTSVQDSLARVRAARPRTLLSRSMVKGLFELQDDLRDKQKLRLQLRLRQSVMLSTAF
jgi:hypothetical protein